MADSKKQLSWKRIVTNQPVYDKISHTLNWAMMKNQFLATLKLSLSLFPRDEKLAEPGFESGSQEMVFWSFLWSHVSFYFIGNQNLFSPKAKKVCFLFNEKFEFVFNWKTAEKYFRVFCPSLFLSLSLSLSLVRTHTHSFSKTLCGAHTRSLARTVHSHSLHLFSSSFRASLFDSRSIFVSKLNNKFCISCLFLFLFAMKKKKNFRIKKFRSNKKKKLVLRKVKHALMFKNQGGRQVWWQKKFGVMTKLGRFAVI